MAALATISPRSTLLRVLARSPAAPHRGWAKIEMMGMAARMTLSCAVVMPTASKYLEA